MSRGRLLFGVALAAACIHASAQQLYKCSSGDGKVTYQAEPCPTASKEDRLRAPPPAPTGGREAQPAAPAEGEWNEATIASGRKSCTDDIVAGARRAWDESLKMGRKVGPFPEEDFRESGEEFCGCMMKRARSSMAAGEFRAQGNKVITKYTEEALAGGECAPTGVVGQGLRGMK